MSKSTGKFFIVMAIGIIFLSINFFPASSFFYSEPDPSLINDHYFYIAPQISEPFDFSGSWSFFITTDSNITKLAIITFQKQTNNQYQVSLGGEFFSTYNPDAPADFPTLRFEPSASASGSDMTVAVNAYFDSFLSSTMDIRLKPISNDIISGSFQQTVLGFPDKSTDTGYSFYTLPSPLISPIIKLCGSQSGPLSLESCEVIIESPTSIPTIAHTPTETLLKGNLSATLGCYAKITSNEENVCTVTIFPDQELADIIFNIDWFLDGALAISTTSQSITIPPLPPGYHEISVIISSPKTDARASASSITEVTEADSLPVPPPATQSGNGHVPPSSPGGNAGNLLSQTGQVSPVGQAASAVGSLGVLAAWLWLEYRNNSQGYERNQQRIAQRVEVENADRRDWFDQRSAENQDFHSQQLINQGYVFNTELGGWVPGPGHPDYEAAQNRQQLEAMAAGLRNLIRLLPPNRQVNLSELLDSITYDRGMDEGALAELNRLRNAIFQQIQGQNEFGQATAEMDQINAESNLAWAQNIQRMNSAAGLIAIGGTFYVNPTALAAVNGELAAIQLLGNFTSGAAGGYVEGGLQTAGIRIAQNILPINTISSLIDKDNSWGDVGWSIIRDTGNVMNLVQGGSYIQDQFAQGASSALSGVVDDVAQSADDLAQVASSSTDDIVRSGDDVAQAASSSTDDLAQSGDDVAQAARSSTDDLAQSGDDLATSGSSNADDLLNSQNQRINQQWHQERILGQQKVDKFNQLLDEYNSPLTSPVRRNQLEGLLEQAASDIKANYQATNIIKNSNNVDLQQAFNTEMRRLYNRVDLDFVENLNNQNVQIGGRPVSMDDFIEFRNNASTGSVGMDRDIGLNQQLLTSIKNRLNQATPGSQEAQELQNYYQYVKNQSQITIEGQQLSNADANQLFQQTYNNSYQNIAGQNANDALQMVTFDQHVEAYADLNVLQNAPENIPFQPGHASQTASVNVHKYDVLGDQVKNGQISEASAIQEVMRGTAKEISNKIEPLMSLNPNVPPEKLEKLIELKDLMSRVGRGEKLPGDAILEIKNRFNVDWADLPEQIGAEFEFLIKNQ